MIRVFRMRVAPMCPTLWCAVAEWAVGGEVDESGDKVYGYNVEARTPDEAVEKTWKHKPRWLPENRGTK